MLGFSMKLKYTTCPIANLGFVSDAEVTKYRKTRGYRNSFLSFVYTQKRSVLSNIFGFLAFFLFQC